MRKWLGLSIILAAATALAIGATSRTLKVDTIQSSVTNGDITLDANGAGGIILDDSLSITGFGTGSVWSDGDVISLLSCSNGEILKWSAGAPVCSADSTSSNSFEAISSTDTTDANNNIISLSGASFTLTLHTAVGNTAQVLELLHSGTSHTQVYTLATTSSQTIGGVAGGSYALYTNGESLKIISDGSNWLILDHKTTGEVINTTLTFDAETTAPTKGTTSTDSVIGYRDGKWLNLHFNYEQTGVGTAGSGNYLLTIPSSLTVDTAITGTNTKANPLEATALAVVGYGGVDNGAGGNNLEAIVHVYSSTKLRVSGIRTGTSSGFWGSSVNPLSDTDMLASLVVRVPISGWQP